MKPSEYFLETRTRLRITQEEMAQRLGCSLSTYKRYESGERVPRADLMDAARAMLPVLAPQIRPIEVVFVPLLAPRVSAGPEHVTYDLEDTGNYAFRKDWIEKIASQPKLYRVKNTSMQPTIRHGDMVMVDFAQHEMADDQIFVVSYMGELLVKRLQWCDHHICMKNDNERVPTLKIDIGDPSFMIFGRVVWIGREL